MPFFSWRVHSHHSSMFYSHLETPGQKIAIELNRQCSVQSGWSSTALLCLLLIKQTIFILGGRLRLTVFIGSRRQTWFYGRRNILFYGQGFYQGGLAVWNIIQERESTNQQNYSSTIQGEGAIKTILQSKSWSKNSFLWSRRPKHVSICISTLIWGQNQRSTIG